MTLVNPPFSRRGFLDQAYNGIGALALSGMLSGESRAAITNPLSSKQTHLQRKAKSCIFLFMQGGVSQMDSFEYKPMLIQIPSPWRVWSIRLRIVPSSGQARGRHGIRPRHSD
jgi:hypothetical protein